MKERGPHQDKVEFSFLKSYKNLEKALICVFGISRNQLKKHHDLKKEFKKPVQEKSRVKISIDIVNHLRINPNYFKEEIKIVYDDDQLIAFSKPAKIHSHPLSYFETDNLLSFMRKSGMEKELRVNELKYDRGLLYRLDFETSGLILYLKNNELYKLMRNNFDKYVIEKKYLAIVMGQYSGLNKVKHFLKGTGPGKRRVLAFDNEVEDSRECELEIKSLEYHELTNKTLLEVSLHQGHRHQIRKQLESLGYPIIGDPLYGNVSAPRMYLHCLKYTVILGEKKVVIEDTEIDSIFNFFNSNS